MENRITEKELSNRGVSAVLGIAGGVALFVLSILITKLFAPLGMVLGVLITGLGISGIFSKSKQDRKPALFTTLVGAVLFLSSGKVFPLISTFAGTILSVCSFASFGIGLYNGVRFLLGLKKIR
ncbi:MAG: hypothetical protein Ta2G_10300 [Termitinemataceae bacterium]|nr:MAG: hypothetical protein Ta2G_10300 [Termitinemataceae bacterium]